MAIFRCRQYPKLTIIDPRDPSQALARFVDGFFASDDPFTIAELSKRAYIERIDSDGDDGDGRRYSYRLEFRRCSRPTCRCARGELHGPYLYAYFREGGKTRRKYVGKAT